MTDPHPTVGRCGDHAPTIPGLTPGGTPVCALPHGHAGWHRDDHGAEWVHGEAPAIADRSTAVAFTRGMVAAHRAAAVAGGEQYLAALRGFGVNSDGIAAVQHAQDLSRQAAAAWQNAADTVGDLRPVAALAPEVAAAFTAEAVQLDLMAEALETVNRMSPSPGVEGEIRAYRTVAQRLRNKTNPTTEVAS